MEERNPDFRSSQSNGMTALMESYPCYPSAADESFSCRMSAMTELHIEVNDGRQHRRCRVVRVVRILPVNAGKAGIGRTACYAD